MMNSYEIYFIISGILGFIGQAIILVFSAIYYFKTKFIGGLLMLIASLLLILAHISQPVISATIAAKFGPEQLITMQGILSISNSIWGLLFAIGFVMVILRPNRS